MVIAAGQREQRRAAYGRHWRVNGVIQGAEGGLERSKSASRRVGVPTLFRKMRGKGWGTDAVCTALRRYALPAQPGEEALEVMRGPVPRAMRIPRKSRAWAAGWSTSRRAGRSSGRQGSAPATTASSSRTAPSQRRRTSTASRCRMRALPTLEAKVVQPRSSSDIWPEAM